MNWEAIGAVGEAVGALGVIATLVYLAAQIRQNSHVVRSATRQAVSTAQTDIGIKIATTPELSGALARWVWTGDAASVPEDPIARMRDEAFLRALLRMFENQYHQNKDGTFEDALWAGYFENMKRVFIAPPFLGFWEASRVLYSTEFAAFVDVQIEEARIGAGAGRRDAAVERQRPG